MAWDWSARDYRRLLDVIALRARGVRRRDEQRIQLFQSGASLPMSDVRSALRRTYRANAKRMNRELRTHFWPVGAIPPAVERLTGEVLDLSRSDGFMARLDPESRAAVATAAQDLTTNPAVRLIMQSATDLWFRPEAEASQRELAAGMAGLPPQLEPLKEDLAALLAAGAGLLATGEFGNAIVEAIDALSDDDLVALRDFMLEWNRLCAAATEALGQPRDGLEPAEALLNEALHILGPAFQLRSNEERFVMMGTLATFAARNANFREFIHASIKWRLAERLAAAARQVAQADTDGAAEAMDADLAAAGVRAGVRARLVERT
jgi:hypothetical protein